MTKLKKPSRKLLVRNLDRIFSLYIRKVYTSCVNCGTTESLTCGHLFSRIAYSTRWDELNCTTQCMSCNMRHEYDSYPLTSWFLDKYGREAYDQLHFKHRKTHKFSNADLQELIVVYTDKYNEIS